MFSFAGKYTSMLMEFVSVMVVSRILTPAELGVFSLAMGSIAIGQMLRDFGLSLYIVQEKELTDEKIQGCFTISVILCWSIALLYYLSAPMLGRFFENDSVEFLVKILAVNFLIIPFGTFTLSLLRRAMKFDSMMVIDVTTALVRSSTAIVLVLSGQGVVSLAYASLAGACMTVLMSIKHTNWLHYRISFKHMKNIASFSSLVSASNIISELKATIPEMIIGKQISVESVAYFSKANATLGLFYKLITSAITPVIQPHISKIRREKKNTDEVVYQIQNYTLSLQWPFCIFIFVFANGVIGLLYGPQWQESVALTSVLAVLLFIDGFTVFGEQLLNAVGRVGFIFRLALLTLFLRVSLVLLLVPYGLKYIVASFLVVTLIKTAVLFPVMYKEFSLNTKRLFNMYWLNLKICLPLLLLAFAADYVIKLVGYNDLYVLLIAVIYGLCWLLLVTFFKHPIHLQVRGVLQKLKLVK
jgi:O-antigen/teichoic acid export membrane protein